MDILLENYLNNLDLNQLLQNPVGIKLKQAIKIYDVIQQHATKLIEKQDELGLTGIKAITVMTFAVLKKMADGKSISNLTNQDWKEIGSEVSLYAVLADGQEYSVYIFSMYEKYIRGSAEMIEGVVPENISTSIYVLADEIAHNKELLDSGSLSEVDYIEACLWISLEAMVKLLASTAYLSGDIEIADLKVAMASYAFEYGRLMLYRKEQELLQAFLESQYQLDAELEEKYYLFSEELKKQAEQFSELIDNAFSPDFRTAFLQSIVLAQVAGVNNSEILSAVEDIDDFFLN